MKRLSLHGVYERERERETLVVTSGEEDGGGFVADEALGDASVSRGGGRAIERRRVTGLLVQDGGGRQDLDGESVAGGAWL